MHQWLLVDTAIAVFLLEVLLCQWLLVHSLLAAFSVSLLILQTPWHSLDPESVTLSLRSTLSPGFKLCKLYLTGAFTIIF